MMIANEKVAKAAAMTQLSIVHDPLTKGPPLKAVPRRSLLWSWSTIWAGIMRGVLPCERTSLGQPEKSLISSVVICLQTQLIINSAWGAC